MRRSLVLFLSLLTGTGTQAWAAPRPLTFSGRVVEIAGPPVGGATVAVAIDEAGNVDDWYPSRSPHRTGSHPDAPSASQSPRLLRYGPPPSSPLDPGMVRQGSSSRPRHRPIASGSPCIARLPLPARLSISTGRPYRGRRCACAVPTASGASCPGTIRYAPRPPASRPTGWPRLSDRASEGVR
jgi:hypothetical protein